MNLIEKLSSHKEKFVAITGLLFHGGLTTILLCENKPASRFAHLFILLLFWNLGVRIEQAKGSAFLSEFY